MKLLPRGGNFNFSFRYVEVINVLYKGYQLIFRGIKEFINIVFLFTNCSAVCRL